MTEHEDIAYSISPGLLTLPPTFHFFPLSFSSLLPSLPPSLPLSLSPMCFCIYWSTSRCMYCLHAEARGERQLPCSITLCFITPRQGLSLTLELDQWSVSCNDPPVFAPPPPLALMLVLKTYTRPRVTFYISAGIQTQILRFFQKALLLIGPSPQTSVTVWSFTLSS